MSVSTADLWDERGDELQSCSVQLRHYGGRTTFSGVISTVRCHRDNALVKAALAEPGEGRVLVVDGQGSLESALMGDLIAASAVASSTALCATSWRCVTCPWVRWRWARTRARARRRS